MNLYSCFAELGTDNKNVQRQPQPKQNNQQPTTSVVDPDPH
jgi:hypothetical protein